MMFKCLCFCYDENGDDTGADEFASDNEDSRMGVPGVSQIGVSGVTQSPLRNNNDFSRAPTSSVSRTATARRAPTFPRARRSMQSRGQQFSAATEHDEHDDDVNHGIIVESWGISNNHLH